VIEEGDHTSLVARGGHYAELYTTYFRHQADAYQPWEKPQSCGLRSRPGACF
jgi:hypothetical protein